MQRSLRHMEPVLKPSPQFYWMAGLLLVSSLVWGLQNAIEDEAFLMFLADTVVDETSENSLTDPLHMVEHELPHELSNEQQESDEANESSQREHTEIQEAN